MRKNTLWEAFLPSRMNQAWLHHTHAGYSVSQKVLNATEKCLREQLAKAQEQRESSAEHRRRVALCNCVKKLLLLLSSRAQLFLLLRATSTVWVLWWELIHFPDHLKWIMMMIYPTIYLCYLHAFYWFLLLNHYSFKKPCVALAMRTAGRQMMLLHDLEMRPKLW